MCKMINHLRESMRSYMQIGLFLYNMSEMMKNVLVANKKVMFLRGFLLIFALYLDKVFVKQVQIKTNIDLNSI